jgi:hypothetical protein
MMQQYRFRDILYKIRGQCFYTNYTEQTGCGRGDKTEVLPLQFAARLTVIWSGGVPSNPMFRGVHNESMSILLLLLIRNAISFSCNISFILLLYISLLMLSIYEKIR